MRKGTAKIPTQADVARLAGVAQATVSQVLNGNTTITISPATREKVLNAVKELGYVPNHTARSLRTRKTETIAMVVPDITNPFYPTFGRGIQGVSAHKDYDLIIYDTRGDAAEERQWLESTRRGRIDGVIGIFFHLTAKDFGRLLEQGIFVVRLESSRQKDGKLPLDNLFVDNTAAAVAATEYLISCGHSRIAMITAQQGPREKRVLGFRTAMAAHASLEATLIEVGDFTERGGYAGMTQLLELASPPSGVFAANDLIAIGALKAVLAKGLRVPQDVSIIGFDDIPAAALVNPPLTTVSQFPEKLGQRAAELLFERIHDVAPPGGRNIELPYELVIRESVRKVGNG